MRSFWCPRRLFDRLNERGLTVDRVAGPCDIYHAAGTLLFGARARHYVYTVGGIGLFVRPDVMPAEYVRKKQAYLRHHYGRVTHFLAVSETTRRELMEVFDIAPERITAIPLGVDETFRVQDPARARAGLAAAGLDVPRRYVLYVGGIQSNKNIVGLVRAFELASALSDHHLLLVGPCQQLDRDIEEAVARSPARERIRLTGPLAGESLAAVYAAADQFVFPSFYEGWTSPPLEAMACGVPVVASSASSIPETVGDAALLASPDDPAEIAAAMNRLVEDPSLTAELVARGQERAAYYSWDRCIRETVSLYQRLMASELAAC